MTTTEDRLQADWTAWHDEREEQLRTPHGWLSLTALHWLDTAPTEVPDLPGRWRATGDGGVELTTAPTTAGALAVDGAPVHGGGRLEPGGGKPGGAGGRQAGRAGRGGGAPGRGDPPHRLLRPARARPAGPHPHRLHRSAHVP